MKHPHCNRSKAAHLFWCRGFAPVVFILAIALIVVAIGSGIYFGVSKETAQAPGPQDVVASSSTESTMLSAALPTTTEVVADTQGVVATTPVAVTSAMPTVPTVPTVPVKPVAVSTPTSYDCGSGKTAEQCFAERLRVCAPAKATVVDPASGLTAERIIDGYKGNTCSYRTNILSGEGNLALLAGMQINCLLPKTLLSSGVSMSKEDMLSYCTGSFIDLLREQMQ